MRITVPSRSDAFLRKFTEVIGGPLGRHSSPGRISPGFFTVERVLVILTVVAALLAVASKNACRLNGWGGTNSYAWACYSDWTALFYARGFADNAFAPFASGALVETVEPRAADDRCDSVRGCEPAADRGARGKRDIDWRRIRRHDDVDVAVRVVRRVDLQRDAAQRHVLQHEGAVNRGLRLWPGAKVAVVAAQVGVSPTDAGCRDSCAGTLVIDATAHAVSRADRFSCRSSRRRRDSERRRLHRRWLRGGGLGGGRFDWVRRVRRPMRLRHPSREQRQTEDEHQGEDEQVPSIHRRIPPTGKPERRES